MNTLFVVTGKAGKNGHEQWRKVNEEDFSTRIYTHSKREASEASRLEIELRSFQGNIYSYYTYLKAKNVAQVKSKEDEEKHEKHGRTGSFFGMTIRVQNGYIRDISKLYSIFEQIFENRIKGTILTDKDTDGYLTYMIEKLADGENAFTLAEKDLLAAISPNDILKLPENCVTQQQRIGEVKTKCFNVVDTAHSSFFPTLFNDAEVNVSREYDTFAEIENRRKQEEARKKAEEQRKEQEELDRQKRESKDNSTRSSNNPPIHTTIEGDKATSSSNVRVRESQQQSSVSTNDTDSTLSDSPINQNVTFVKLLLKVISTIQRTNEILLSFAVQQLRESKTKKTCSSECKEYEEKLSIINYEIEATKDDLNKLLDKYSNNKENTLESLFPNLTQKAFDYKLFLPIGVIIIIVLGLFIGIHNPESDSTEEITVTDTIVTTIDDHTKDTTKTINNHFEIKNDTIFYIVTDGNAKLRPTPGGQSMSEIIPKKSIFKGMKDTVINGTKWIYGFDVKGRIGYTDSNNLDIKTQTN